MSKKTDIIVVGSGLAGLTAALSARASGRQVLLITHGVGSLAVSSGCIDVLGYHNGCPVQDPIADLPQLNPEHPYSLAGAERVEKAIDWLQSLCLAGGLNMQKNLSRRNHELITVMGTLKPSYLCPESFCTECFAKARRAAVVSFENMKDVHPLLIIDQLHRYARFADMEFMEAMLPCPIDQSHRNVTPLDVARFVDTPEGLEWLRLSLEPYAKLYPILLMPPVLGVKNSQKVWGTLCDVLKVRIVEMVSIPPGVAGLRLREVLRNALNEAGITMIENALAVRAVADDKKCLSVVTSGAGGEHSWEASQFIIATGGILGGGVATSPGKAWETIFNIPIKAPENPQEWSSTEIFGRSFFSQMGVRVNADLKAIDDSGAVLYENVRFAGRTIGGYDYASEKSGHGTALVTGMLAGELAGKE
ncbi:MAG: anaerobic glycerol-3-phosphate dehydrogenase subunit B [Mailhella sp.]|nr:anaerobic glycerol-3-phosphate dehydrogenase subunit B [Mailhella sp.]